MGSAPSAPVVHAIVALLALAVGACTGTDARSDESAWEFKADTTPSAQGTDAASTTWLRVVGKEGAEGEAPTKDVILSFDCAPDHTGSTILTEQALRQGTVEVQLGLDEKPPRELPAFAGTTPTGGQVALTIRQDSLLALLSDHQRATVHYADGAGSSKTVAVFPVAGVEQYRGPFLAACGRRGDAGGR